MIERDSNKSKEAAKILIVEDEGVVALDVQHTLRRLGYQVCGIAATGDEAIRLTLTNQPDLILMDIRLAGEMDGIEAAEHIQAVSDISIIFLTAYADQATLDRAKATQPFGYLTKPLDIKDLQITIEISLYRHAMEKRERQNAYRFEQVFNTVAHGLILLDENNIIQLANQHAHDYLKILTQPDMLTIGDRLHHLDGQSIDEYFTSSSPGTLTKQTHEIVINAPQERVFVLDVVALTQSPGEPELSVVGWVLTLQDITEARQHDHAQRQQERLAAVGQLAAGIAHDFGNILASISLAAQIMPQLESNLGAKSTKHLNRIRNQVKRATDLVSQILDFSRTSYLEWATVDLIPLYKEWLKLLDHTLSEDIKLRFGYPEDPCVVNADPTRMQQVLWNLVLNARDALPHGGNIEVMLDTVAFDAKSQPPLTELQGGEWIRVRVSDTGTGIAPDVLPHIFEPFYTTKAPGQGTGLGLAQVYGIVQQHNGLIHVSGNSGKGTTFTVFLPAVTSPVCDCSYETQPSLSLVQGNGETLLVVEDDEHTRQALAESLIALNYQVTEATDGEDALAHLRNGSSTAELVVTDHIMSRVGALEFCRELKQSGMDLPVIVVSGYAREDEVEILKQLGIVEYLRKPVCLEHLSEIIAQTLGNRERGLG